MPPETTLDDITARFRQGRFPNEQAISQGVVLRIRQELSWDTCRLCGLTGAELALGGQLTSPPPAILAT